MKFNKNMPSPEQIERVRTLAAANGIELGEIKTEEDYVRALFMALPDDAVEKVVEKLDDGSELPRRKTRLN